MNTSDSIGEAGKNNRISNYSTDQLRKIVDSDGTRFLRAVAAQMSLESMSIKDVYRQIAIANENDTRRTELSMSDPDIRLLDALDVVSNAFDGIIKQLMNIDNLYFKTMGTLHGIYSTGKVPEISELSETLDTEVLRQ